LAFHYWYLLSLFHEVATTFLHTLSLHDALPIFRVAELDSSGEREGFLDRIDDLDQMRPHPGLHDGIEHGFDLIHRIEEISDEDEDRKSTRLNSSHVKISYAVFCFKKKKIDIDSS